MGDRVTFAPNTVALPQFSGRGSRIQRPDLYPMFLGPYWPGTGNLTVSTVMKALYSVTGGPYLDGLKQYGFIGPAQVRSPRIDQSPFNVALPALAPNVSQIPAVSAAVRGYINNLLEKDEIVDVDDNHELIVLVFLDPSIRAPQQMDSLGNISGASGVNTTVEKFEFLDDNTRFEWVWIDTASQDLGSVTQTMTHELVEAISDPFGSGWHQIAPSPSPSAGQIADVCNQPGVVNGVSVVAYWSAEDSACIVPTSGVRRVSLVQELTKHEPQDGAKKQGFVDLGSPLCAAGFFEYFERTYANELTASAMIDGYEEPVVDWRIDGQQVPLLQGSLDVSATWMPEPPPSASAPAPVKATTARLITTRLGPAASQITVSVGPGAGNTSFRIDLSVSDSFDLASSSGNNSTKRTAVLEVDLKNQEIIWASEFINAKKNCERLKHLSDGPSVVIGPPRPGDPFDLAGIVSRALREQGPERAAALKNAAAALEGSRPELAEAVMSLAKRTR